MKYLDYIKHLAIGISLILLGHVMARYLTTHLSAVNTENIVNDLEMEIGKPAEIMLNEALEGHSEVESLIEYFLKRHNLTEESILKEMDSEILRDYLELLDLKSEWLAQVAKIRKQLLDIKEHKEEFYNKNLRSSKIF